MNKLIEILKKYEVEEYEAAEMIYAYLLEHENDGQLIDEIYDAFFNKVIND